MKEQTAKLTSCGCVVGCLAVMLLVLLVVAGLIGWAVVRADITGHFHRQQFDARLWRTQDTVEHDPMWPPRLRMVDRLMSSSRLDGLTKDQVVELLGPPHEKTFPFGAADCDVHYYLGPERGFVRIDSEWLFITFDDDGKVERYWLYRD